MCNNKSIHSTWLKTVVFVMAAGISLLVGCIPSSTISVTPVDSIKASPLASPMPTVVTTMPQKTPTSSVVTPVVAPSATSIVTSSIPIWATTAPSGIVYTSVDHELWLVDEDGKSILVARAPQIITSPRVNLSPDQTFVLYDDSDHCWITDLNAGDAGNITEIISSETPLVCQLALDNKAIYYSNGTDIWETSIHSPETTRNLTKTSERYENKLLPIWSAHPDRLFFYSRAVDETQDDLGAIGALTTIHIDGTKYKIIEETIAVDLPAFSPNGLNLAYIKNHELWFYQLDIGSQKIDFAEYGLGEWEIWFTSPAWSPNGIQLAGWAEGKQKTTDDSFYGILLLDTQEKSVRIFAPLYHPVFWDGHPPAPEWSPDGRWLIYWGEDEYHQHLGINVIDIQGGEVYSLAAENDTEESCANTWGPGDRVWSPDFQWLAFSRCEKIAQTAYVKQGIWLAQVGKWEAAPIDLPQEVELVGWISIVP